VVLDEDDTVGVKGAASRGICYTQKSLEIFERLGIYERIAAKGIQWSVGRTFAGQDEIYAFDLRQQSSFQLSAQPPFINIQQFYIEGFLVERIQALAADRPGRWTCAGCRASSASRSRPDVPPRSRNTRRALRAGGHPCGGRQRLAHTLPPVVRRPACRPVRGDDRWCIADVRFAHRRRHRAPHLDRGALQRQPRRLAAPDG
jgi:3-(3-hydroxy-phenyl)propionate hydroxylase